MKTGSDAILLRIYCGEEDETADGRPVYEALVLKAREMGLAGATVLRGPMGFGHSSVLHTAKVLRLSDDLPMVVEFVDLAARIEAFIPEAEALSRKGLITAERITIVSHPGAEAEDTPPAT